MVHAEQGRCWFNDIATQIGQQNWYVLHYNVFLTFSETQIPHFSFTSIILQSSLFQNYPNNNHIMFWLNESPQYANDMHFLKLYYLKAEQWCVCCVYQRAMLVTYTVVLLCLGN